MLLRVGPGHGRPHSRGKGVDAGPALSWGAASDPGSSAASQREVLHPRRQVRIASGPQGSRAAGSTTRDPRFRSGFPARRTSPGARSSRKSRSSGGISRRPALSGSTSCAKPTSSRFQRLAWRSRRGKRHDLRADRLPRGAGYSSRQLSGCAVSTSFTVPPWVRGSRVARGHRHAALRVQVDLVCPLEHPFPHVFPLPHTVVSRLQGVKGEDGQFFLVLQRVSGGFATGFANRVSFYFNDLWAEPE